MCESRFEEFEELAKKVLLEKACERRARAYPTRNPTEFLDVPLDRLNGQSVYEAVRSGSYDIVDISKALDVEVFA